MTKARDLANIISGGFTADDIPNLDAAKITSGSLADARIPNLAASKITSGTFADGRIAASNVTQHASTFDDNQIQTNLTLLGFKTQINGSIAKYSLQDNVIDEFIDNTGIDETASTGESIVGGAVAGTFSFDGAETLVGDAVGTPIGTHTSGGGLSAAFDGTDHPTAAAGSQHNSADFGSLNSNSISFIGKNWGTGNAKSISKIKIHSTSTEAWSSSNSDSASNGGMQIQLYGNNVNDTSTATALGTISSAFNGRNYNAEVEHTDTGSGLFQYHWVGLKSSSTSGGRGHYMGEVEFFEEALSSATNFTLISTATTASTAPTSASLIFIMENNLGTATLNTDIKGFISRDNGSTYTEVTLVDEGTYGTDQKIVVAHDVDISSQPSGTSMRYKIQAFNQGSSKITKVRAVSLGWK